MKVKVFFFIVLQAMLVNLKGQEAGVKAPGEFEKLDASDLLFRDDTVELNVISASRSSKRIGELPITIHVVTREEIILNHYYSLTDIIKSLPGIRVSQPGSGELGEIFELRGLIGNMYTMILVNGLPVKPSAVIGMPVASQLPVRQAERIEVIYGPAAAVYGADAVSGVINIITKEADKGTFVMGDISLGQLDYKNFNFMAGGKTGKNKNILQYTFYGGQSESSDLKIKNGYEEAFNPMHQLQKSGVTFNIEGAVYEPLEITETLLRSKNFEPADFIREVYPANYNGSLLMPSMENLPSSGNNMGFNLKFRGISLSFNNMYRRAHSSLGQSSYFYRFDDPRNYWGENIRSTTLSYNREWSPKFTTTSNISNLDYKMDNNSGMGVTFIGYTDKVYRYAAGRDLLFEQLATVVPVNNLEIISGLSYQYSGNLPQTSFLDSPFNSREYGSFSKSVAFPDTISRGFGINPLVFHNFSLFSQAYYTLKSFRFMGGARVDDNSRYGSSVSPRIAGLYILNRRTSLRGSAGLAFKSPPSSLSFQSLAFKTGQNRDSLIYLSVPNPGLKPEKYLAVELGIIKKYRKNININLSVYYNEIRNLITDMRVPVATLNLPLAVQRPGFDTVLVRSNSEKSLSRLYGMQGTMMINDIVKSIHLNAEVSLTFATASEKFPELFKMAGDYLGHVSNFSLIPKHFGQMKISFNPTRNLYIRATSIWQSSWLRLLIPFRDLYEKLFEDIDGYYCMDLVGNYRFGSNLNGFIKVNNLFDEKYGGTVYSGTKTPLPYNPQSGRFIQIGLTYTLN